MKKIAILGAGEFGRALAHLLRKSNNQITFWDEDETKLKHDMSCDLVVQEAEIIFLAIPSWTVRETLGKIKKCFQTNAIIVSVSKGVEPGGATMDEVLEEEIGTEHKYVLLSGPMLAEEIMHDMPTGSVLASKDIEVAKEISELFTKSDLRTVYSDDLRGLALCGVLKNIYTIALGMSRGLGYGDNTRGFIISQAIHEIVAYVEKLGGKKETVFGAAGLGDLITTSAGMFSQNFTFGYTFVRAADKNVTAEGARSFLQIEKLLGDDVPKYPLLYNVIQVLKHKKTQEALFKDYFNEEDKSFSNPIA